MEDPVKENKNYFKSSKYLFTAIITIICLGIAIGIVLLAKSFIEPKKEVKSIATNDAETLFYDKKYDKAINAYEELQQKEEWPIYNVKIAEIYTIQGNVVKSNEILQKSYQTRNKLKDTGKESNSAKDKEVVNQIALTYLMNNEYQKALESGEMFLKDYPDDKQLIKTMFTIYLANKQNDKAKQILSSYSTEDASASDLAILARMNMLVNDFDTGFSLLKDAWHKDKDEVKIYDVLEEISQNNQQDILNKISDLQAKDSDELAYKMWTAKVYSTSKSTSKQASSLIKELEYSDVGLTSLKQIKANVYKNTNKTKDTQEALETIIDSDKQSFTGYYTAAVKDCNEGKYKEALDSAKKAAGINIDYTGTYASLIPDIMIKQNKIEEAEPYLMTALYKEPFNDAIVSKIADYYRNDVKDTTKALYYYDLVSKLNQNDPEVYYEMAQIKIDNQRYDEAAELLKKSVSINDKVSKYHRALGSAYLNLGKNDDAINEIRNSYYIYNNDILTLNNAACYYVCVEGDVNRAKINLKAAYDNITEKTTPEVKQAITDNYNKVKALSSDDQKSGPRLSLSDLKIFY